MWRHIFSGLLRLALGGISRQISSNKMPNCVLPFTPRFLAVVEEFDILRSFSFEVGGFALPGRASALSSKSLGICMQVLVNTNARCGLGRPFFPTGSTSPQCQIIRDMSLYVNFTLRRSRSGSSSSSQSEAEVSEDEDEDEELEDSPSLTTFKSSIGDVGSVVSRLADMGSVVDRVADMGSVTDRAIGGGLLPLETGAAGIDFAKPSCSSIDLARKSEPALGRVHEPRFSGTGDFRPSSL
mmetsp:Transcript_48735/g.91251  ORF Transcript_48735/g.91251 Transcript_48735/m.91251 type:complete len:240 (+) Transcript_48735:244-963(+)